MHSAKPPYVQWHLEFSSYKAYFPTQCNKDSGDIDFVQCHVYHTCNIEAFLNICSKLKITTLPDGETLKDLSKTLGSKFA